MSKSTLDNTTRPADAAEARQRKAEVKANRPEPADVAPIVSRTPREKKIAREIIKRLAMLVNSHIKEIMQDYDDQIALHDSDRKFTFPIPVGIVLTGDDPKTYSVAVKLSCKVKRSFQQDGQVREDDDLVDEMNRLSGDATDDDDDCEDSDLFNSMPELDAPSESEASGDEPEEQAQIIEFGEATAADLTELNVLQLEALITNQGTTDAEVKLVRAEFARRGLVPPDRPETAKPGRKPRKG